MKRATDGSIQIKVNDVGVGLLTVEGYLRVRTSPTNPGLYHTDGAINASISNNATPANGDFGVYTRSFQGWRMSQTGSSFFGTTGLHGTDGSYRVTVIP